MFAILGLREGGSWGAANGIYQGDIMLSGSLGSKAETALLWPGKISEKANALASGIENAATVADAFVPVKNAFKVMKLTPRFSNTVQSKLN